MKKRKYSIGIDMGGTNTKFGIVDRKGNVLYSSEVSTSDDKTIEGLMLHIFNILKPKMDEYGGAKEFVGVGVGAPNANYLTGNIEFAANLPWGEIVPLLKTVKAQFKLPCKVTDDAKVAALGEMKYGLAKSMKNFIMITLGTGVGSGIVVNGKVVYGERGIAGELGHTIIIPDGRKHPNTNISGTLESYCSATGVRATALEKLAASEVTSLLRNIPPTELNSKSIYDAAIQGDKIANDAFEFTGEILGIAFANFIMTFSPKAIILFGGLAKAGDLLTKPLLKSMDKYLLKIYKGKVPIIMSQLKSADAAILGASALMLE